MLTEGAAPTSSWPTVASGARAPESVGASRRPLAKPILLSEYERQVLQQTARSACSTHFQVVQARIVLLAADGASNRAISRRLSVKLDTVIRWRERFFRRRLEGLQRLPMGRPPTSDRRDWHRTVGVLEASRLPPPTKLERPWELIERAPPNGVNPRAQAALHMIPPGRPPCFDTDTAWREYVVHAAVHSRHAMHGPIMLTPGRPATLNAGWSFCEDCEPRHQGQMRAQRRCDPGWLQRAAQV